MNAFLRGLLSLGLLLPAAAARAGDCPELHRQLDAARAGLRDCVAAGGDCAAGFQAVENALVALSSCPEQQEPSRALMNPRRGVVHFTDGSVLSGMVVASAGMLAITSQAGMLAIPFDAVLRLDFGELPPPVVSSLVLPPLAVSHAAAAETPAPAARLPGSSAAPSVGFAAGRVEVGGGVSFSSQHGSVSIDGNTTTITGANLQIAPFVGYFLTDQMEMLASVNFQRSWSSFTGGNNQDNAGTQFQLGATYLLKPGDGFYLGPIFDVGYSLPSSGSTTSGVGTSITESGLGFFAGVIAKVPFGHNLVFAASVGYYQDSYSITESQGSATGSGTDAESGFQTSASFSALF
jgi:hypothetical protein